jgi:aryl carrier-like protein
VSTPARSRESLDEFVHTWLDELENVRKPIESGLMLIELGLDSLDVVELSRSLRAAGIAVDPAEIDAYATLTETMALIYERAQID